MQAKKTALVAGIILALALLVPLVGTAATKSPETLLAIYYHADWCPACKDMGPLFKRLQKSDRGSKVAYIRLNLTDRITIGIAQEVAAGRGIDDIFRYSRNTGVIILVDALTLEKIEELDLKLSIAEMARHIDAAAAKR